MPTNGSLGHHHATRGREGDYTAGRLRAMQTTFAQQQRLEKDRALRERERRSAQRGVAAEMRAEGRKEQQAARLELEAVRSNPLYGLYKRWGRRANNATVYDAETWRRTGRLRPITERTKYAGGRRREGVDFTDVLDREAQELGIASHDLPRHFERLQRQEDHARQSMRDADSWFRDADAIARGE